MPGYVKTNVCKNAMMSAPGETFGKTDPNIGTGMDPGEFARQTVVELYLKNTECSVADNWPIIKVLFILRGLWPNFVFNFAAKETEKQLKAVAEAQKEE